MYYVATADLPTGITGPQGDTGPKGNTGIDGSVTLPISVTTGGHTYSLDFTQVGTVGTFSMGVEDGAGTTFSRVSFVIDTGATPAAIATVAAGTPTHSSSFAVQGGIAAAPNKHFILTTDGHVVNLSVMAGSPNGTVSGTAGDLVVDISSPALWQCQGTTTWISL